MYHSFPKIPIHPDEFSGMTFRVRYPKILSDVIDSDLFDVASTEKLISLKRSLDTQLVVRLSNTPSEYWAEFYQEFEGKKLIDLPFFDAEIYLFALINELVQYDQLNIDPFSKIKSEDLSKSLLAFDLVLKASEKWDTAQFILNNLHGNKSDLSQLKHGESIDIDIILDDRHQLEESLANSSNIDLVLDNAGMELFSDLLLVDHLIRQYDHQITLHIKSSPLFVSDVIEDDITKLLDFLSHHQSAFVDRIHQHLEKGQINILAHPFWNSPKHFDNIPSGLIPGDSVLITKGDANYRRFFGDRIIDPTIHASELTGYLKQDTFAVRTLKSDIQTSLDQNQVEDLENKNKDWKNVGQFAVIQKVSG